MREKKNAYRVLVGKPEGKRSLGRPRSRREDGVVWIRLMCRWIGTKGELL
jgi:hypothetical protein